MVAATALGVVVGVRPDILHRSSKILQRQQNLETEETAKEKVNAAHTCHARVLALKLKRWVCGGTGGVYGHPPLFSCWLRSPPGGLMHCPENRLLSQSSDPERCKEFRIAG